MPSQPAPVPPDDLSRKLTVARPDHDQSLPHIGLVGDTYTILVTGEDTAGKYTLIDMHVPPGGGPPPHRHDFEEMFTVLDGEVRVTFRGETLVARAGETINVAGQRPTRIHQRRRYAVAAAVPVRARRAGVSFHPGRPARRYPDRGAAAARRRRVGGLPRQGAGARARLQDRTASAAWRGVGLPSTESSLEVATRSSLPARSNITARSLRKNRCTSTS